MIKSAQPFPEEVSDQAVESVESNALQLPDCQNESDVRRLRIDRVGVKNLLHPIQVSDRERSTQSTVARVSLSVDLPQHRKGTHMSRFIEILNAHGRHVHVESVAAILDEMQRKLHAETAHIEIEFPYFVEKAAPVTRSQGWVDYEVKLEATARDRVIDLLMSVKVPVTTLCPCSKAISQQGAHNQRGYVTLALRSERSIWIEEAIEMVEQSASSQIYSLLKRPDEKFVTEHAYENPVFVEDLVRNVAVRCNRHPAVRWYRVEAENMESIHNHAAYACIENAREE
jgi:GTP cyclohydrolase I